MNDGQELILATKEMLDRAEGHSSNEQDTARTAEQAQENLNWWRLLRGVSPDEDKDPMVCVLHDAVTEMHSWQTTLVHGLAKLNGGFTRYGYWPKAALYVVGRKVDVELLVYYTGFCIREVNRLSEAWSEGVQRLSFCVGARNAIFWRMVRSRAEWDRQHASMADIDLAEKGALNQYWKRHYGELPADATLDHGQLDQAAYRAGTDAGEKIGANLKEGLR